MSCKKLGKIIEIPPRNIWKYEQYEFSKWLVEENNLKELSEILGLSLIDAELEKPIGNYRCDIVCKDEISHEIVVIENQIEPTNHDHLGKIITYAASLKATTIVWIVEKSKEEHRRAIEWLNENINSSISFFLIELHIIKINDSEPAPQFRIIEAPNDFNNANKTQNKLDKKISENEGNRYDFWTKFNDVLEKRKFPFNKRKPTTQSWYDFSIGSSICHLCMVLVNRDGFIRIMMDIHNSKEQFDVFYKNKNAIELKLGMKLFWDRKDNKKAAWISCKINGLNFENKSNYDELMNKSIDMLINMKKAFKPYLIKNVN